MDLIGETDGSPVRTSYRVYDVLFARFEPPHVEAAHADGPILAMRRHADGHYDALRGRMVRHYEQTRQRGGDGYPLEVDARAAYDRLAALPPPGDAVAGELRAERLRVRGAGWNAPRRAILRHVDGLPEEPRTYAATFGRTDVVLSVPVPHTRWLGENRQGLLAAALVDGIGGLPLHRIKRARRITTASDGTEWVQEDRRTAPDGEEGYFILHTLVPLAERPQDADEGWRARRLRQILAALDPDPAAAPGVRALLDELHAEVFLSLARSHPVVIRTAGRRPGQFAAFLSHLRSMRDVFRHTHSLLSVSDPRLATGGGPLFALSPQEALDFRVLVKTREGHDREVGARIRDAIARALFPEDLAGGREADHPSGARERVRVRERLFYWDLSFDLTTHRVGRLLQFLSQELRTIREVEDSATIPHLLTAGEDGLSAEEERPGDRTD